MARNRKARLWLSASKPLEGPEEERLAGELHARGFLEGGGAPLIRRITRSMVVDTTRMDLPEAHPGKGRSVRTVAALGHEEGQCKPRKNHDGDRDWGVEERGVLETGGAARATSFTAGDQPRKKLLLVSEEGAITGPSDQSGGVLSSGMELSEEERSHNGARRPRRGLKMQRGGSREESSGGKRVKTRTVYARSHAASTPSQNLVDDAMRLGDRAKNRSGHCREKLKKVLREVAKQLGEAGPKRVQKHLADWIDPPLVNLRGTLNEKVPSLNAHVFWGPVARERIAKGYVHWRTQEEDATEDQYPGGTQSAWFRPLPGSEDDWDRVVGVGPGPGRVSGEGGGQPREDRLQVWIAKSARFSTLKDPTRPPPLLSCKTCAQPIDNESIDLVAAKARLRVRLPGVLDEAVADLRLARDKCYLCYKYGNSGKQVERD